MFDYTADHNRKFRRHRRPMDDLRKDFYSPKSIDKLFVWYDSTRTDSIVKDGSNFISTWKDLGQNGLDLSNSGSTSTKPTFVSSGINSKPSVSFDGGDSLQTVSLYGTSVPETQEWLGIYGDFQGHRRQTYVWVSLPSVASSTYKVWRINSGAADVCFFSRHTSFSNNPIWSYENTISAYNVFSSTINPQNDTTNPHMWRFSKTSATDDIYNQVGWLYIDEVETTLSTTSPSTQSDAVLFNLGCGDVSNGYQGRIGEFIIYNKLLNARECYYLKNYFKAKWGT